MKERVLELSRKIYKKLFSKEVSNLLKVKTHMCEFIKDGKRNFMKGEGEEKCKRRWQSILRTS